MTYEDRLSLSIALRDTSYIFHLYAIRNVMIEKHDICHKLTRGNKAASNFQLRSLFEVGVMQSSRLRALTLWCLAVRFIESFCLDNSTGGRIWVDVSLRASHLIDSGQPSCGFFDILYIMRDNMTTTMLDLRQFDPGITLIVMYLKKE